jgi:hypothetical protein
MKQEGELIGLSVHADDLFDERLVAVDERKVQQGAEVLSMDVVVFETIEGAQHVLGVAVGRVEEGVYVSEEERCDGGVEDDAGVVELVRVEGGEEGGHGTV